MCGGGGVKASHRYTTPAPELNDDSSRNDASGKVCAVPLSDSLMKLQPDSNFVSAAILIKGVNVQNVSMQINIYSIMYHFKTCGGGKHRVKRLIY